MGKDHVRTGPEAVRSLKRALELYLAQIRLAASHARKEMQQRAREIDQELARRQGDLRRREHEVQVLQTQLARCREGCGGLLAAVRRASVLRNDAAAACQRAQKAAEIAAQAQSDLTRVLHATERVVEDHATAGCVILTRIESQLAMISPSRASGPAAAAVGLATLVQVATAVPDLAQMGANVAAAVGHPNVLSSSSVEDATEDTHQLLVGHWADGELERRKHEIDTIEERS